MTHNLEWRDVEALFTELGDVENEHNGNVRVALSGQSVVFQSPKDSDIATSEQVMQIRHLLDHHGATHRLAVGTDMLLVIDHLTAKVFPSVAEDGPYHVIHPVDAEGHHTHVHSSHDQPGHKQLPHNDAYYQEISEKLLDADRIVIFGSGKGSSSAMDLFMEWLGEHNPKLKERVFDTLVVDESHLTDNQLIAKARIVYAV